MLSLLPSRGLLSNQSTSRKIQDCDLNEPHFGFSGVKWIECVKRVSFIARSTSHWTALSLFSTIML